ncbi:MAG: DUF3048 domain-containing protein [Eubacterium sp.]|nr:DUF3048 domain-containing protein [Eubacterium sp.]
MNKRFLALTLTSAIVLTAFSGCGKKEEEEPTSEATSYSITLNDNSMLDDSDEVLMTRDGKVMSDLTGEWIDQELAKERPMTVMVNNIIDAMPQSGVESAAIIYEMLEEGGITRLMAIYEPDYTGVEKIGPIRSARHYYDRKALEYDAVFVHWGQSIYAQHEFDTLKPLDQVDLNGKDGAYGFRASDRVAPHNAYSSGDKILQAIKSDEFDTNKSSSYKKMFSFNVSEKELEDGNAANKITTAYSEGRKPWFEYDSENKVYKRFQYGEPQIDAETGNQLAFKNVIIQYAKHIPIKGDTVGCIDIEYSGKGEGLYATDGKIIPIKWSKKGKKKFVDYSITDGLLDDTKRKGNPSDYGVTQFTTMDGKPLKLNPGKTWVTVFPDDNKEGIIVE